MLTRSLCCFKGISVDAESRLWRDGCLSWRHLKQHAERHFSLKKAEALTAQLPFYEKALESCLVDFFVGNLPCGYKLRIFPEFHEHLAFIDIETTGLDRRDNITVIGLWHRGKITTFVRGRNLSDFIQAWKSLSLLLTFNGSRFDIPFIMRTFGFTVHPPHIDLFCESQIHGLKGGLKTIERELGFTRTLEESGNGKEAVQLWHRYTTENDDKALEKLIAYNNRDVLSLLALTRHLYRLSCRNYDAPHPLF